jgi:hypothetical protein
MCHQWMEFVLHRVGAALPACCSKIAEAEAAVSVNEKKWLVMHMHVQLQLDELPACWHELYNMTRYCVLLEV